MKNSLSFQQVVVASNDWKLTYKNKLYNFQKSYSKWIMGLTFKWNIAKLLEENIGKLLGGRETSNEF